MKIKLLLAAIIIIATSCTKEDEPILDYSYSFINVSYDNGVVTYSNSNRIPKGNYKVVRSVDKITIDGFIYDIPEGEYYYGLTDLNINTVTKCGSLHRIVFVKDDIGKVTSVIVTQIEEEDLRSFIDKN